MKENRYSCSNVTKNRIADTLREIMKSKSFEKISIADITTACSIHRQTFYYHFADKYELLNWICCNELIEPLINDLSVENIYDKLNDMFKTMKDNQSFYQNAVKINADILFNYVGNFIVKQITPAIVEIEKNNSLVPQDDKETNLIAEFIGYGISGVVIDWVSHSMKETPRELTARINHIIDACKNLAASHIK